MRVVNSTKFPAKINANHPLAQGLIGYWPCGEMGGRKLWDLTGMNHLDGGASSGTWIPSPRGGAITLNGLGGASYTKTVTNLPTGNNAISMSCWFKMDSIPTQCEFMGYGNNAGGGQRWALYYTGNTLYLECAGVSNSFSWTADTNWHHFMFTHASGANLNAAKMYFDGKPKTLSTTSYTINITGTKELKIGGIPTVSNDSYTITGKTEECRIWNRVVSDNEAILLFTNPHADLMR